MNEIFSEQSADFSGLLDRHYSCSERLFIGTGITSGLSKENPEGTVRFMKDNQKIVRIFYKKNDSTISSRFVFTERVFEMLLEQAPD
jgi:hypothetical protein